MTRRRRPEQELQRSLIEQLRWRARPDVWWCAIPNGGWRSPVEGAIFKALGVQPGAPDLLVVRQGLASFIELKAVGGRLSASQIECHRALRGAGAVVETIDDIDAAIAFLTRLEALQ
jgi:hypothetical protein